MITTKIQVEIKSLDNGFILSLFDEDGLAENDETLFLTTKKEVLKKLDEWWKK